MGHENGSISNSYSVNERTEERGLLDSIFFCRVQCVPTQHCFSIRRDLTECLDMDRTLRMAPPLLPVAQTSLFCTGGGTVAPLHRIAYLLHGIVLAVAVTINVGPETAQALSLCTDTDGRQVLTDSPGPLSGCTALESHERDLRPPSVVAPLPTPPSIPEASAPPALAPRELPAHTASVTVPVERLGELMVVTVQLNHDRTARLILDTGASHTLLSHTIAQDLGLFSLPPMALVTLHTVGGSVQSKVVQVDSIQLAGAEVRQSLAAIHDMPDAPPGIEGLLGQSFLRQFEVTVNAAKGELQLRSAK